LTLLVYLLTKKKNNDTTPPNPNTPIDINFTVYNHTQGKIGTYKINTTTGTKTDINIATVLEYLRTHDGDNTKANVDDKRIAIRYATQNNKIGNFIAYSNTGAASITPTTNMTNIEAWLMNASNKAPYNCVDNDTFNGPGGQMYLGKRNYTVKREDKDGYTGPEEVWSGKIDGQEGVFIQMRKAMNPFGITYSIFTIDPNSTNPDYTYGYGKCNGFAGVHLGNHIEVNPVALNQNPIAMIQIGVAEKHENDTIVDDLCGRDSSWTITNTDGNFNSIGKDLYAYVLVKDTANW